MRVTLNVRHNYGKSHTFKMIKDLVDSFKENVKQKTTNPFFGTLIVVWLIHNYKNLYELLFSGTETSYEQKLSVLDKIFGSETFALSLLESIGVAILVLVGTYFLINLSRLVINFFEKKITPWIFALTDKNSIVLKEDYEKLRLERERTQKRFEGERDSRLRLESEIENLEKRIKDLLNADKRGNNSATETDESDEAKLVDLLENKGYLEVFESLIFQINANEWVQEDDSHKFLVTIGLVRRIDKDADYGKYEFTDKGLNFQRFYREKYLYSPTDENESA